MVQKSGAMRMFMTPFHTNSISRNLFLSLLCLLSLVAGTTLYASFRLASYQSRVELERRADEYLTALTHSLALPLWNLDSPVLELIGQTYSHNEAIAEIRIVRADTAQLYLFGRADLAATISRRATIRYQNKVVGSVTISLTATAYTELNRRYFRFYALAIGLMILVLALMSEIVLRRQLQRPFTRFIEMVKAYAAGDAEAFNRSHPSREFASLISVLQNMGRTISTQMQALQERETKYRVLFESFPLGVTVSDAAGNIVETNTMSEKLLGLPQTEHAQRAIDGPEWRIVRADGTPMPAAEYASVRALQEQRRIEKVTMGIVKSTGEVTWLDVTAAPIPLAHYGVVVTYSDMTAYKQAEDALAQSAERFRTVADFTYDWEYWLDPQGQLLYISPSCERITGYPPDEFLHRPELLVQIIHPADRARIAAHHEALTHSSGTCALDFRILTRQAEERWIGHVCQYIDTSDGRVLGRRVSNRDITDRKRAEEALCQREEELRLTLAATTDGIWQWNFETATIWFSPSYYRMLGYEPDEFAATYDKWREMIHPDDQAHALAVATAYLATKPDCYENEFRLRTKRGEYRWIHCDARVVERNDAGEAIRMIGNHEDITTRKQAEEQLRQHAALLEEAVRQKQHEMETLFEKLMRQEKLATIGQMAGSIAHELRNPLGAVKQSVFYLKRLAQQQQLTTANPKVRHHLDLMDAELNTSERVISDLLEMTRLKPPQCVPIDLRVLVEDAVSRVHLREQVRVNLTLTPEPLLIDVDPMHLRQVLLNLLTNAGQSIAGDGAITIRARQLPDEGEAIIEIQDTGVGIAPEALEKIFEPLYTTKATGTGLGLSICKQILDAHQGTISVASQPGQGTTVTIRLPRERARSR